MTAALKGNSDGSGSILVGGSNAINISTSQIVSFVNPLTSITLTTPTLTAPTVSGGLTVASGGMTVSSGSITMAAGTTTIPPLQFTSGSLLTSPVAGTMEFDGSVYYSTDDVTDGRGFIPSVHLFRLTADGTAIGPSIANFFGATSGVALDAGIFYELEAYLYFTKTTAGTAQFTMTFSNAPVNNDAFYVGSQATGVGAVGAPVTAALIKSTATAGALPATASLTTAANHQYVVRSFFQANASTGGTFNLQITSSAGTVTPLTGSYYKLTRMPSANTGAFV